MHKSDSPSGNGSLYGLIEATENLIGIASYRETRNGLIFEHSGDSMAVFDGQYRIDRVSLASGSEYDFQHAIDTWLLNRYMAEIA